MNEGPPTVLRFVISGEPCGKERPRGIIRKTREGKSFTKMVTPPKTRAYEEKIKTLAQIAVNQAKWAWSDRDRFHVLIRVYRTHRDAGPDLDNVVKACSDAVNGVLWRDDRYVWGIGAVMRQDRSNPRVEVEVRRVPKEAA